MPDTPDLKHHHQRRSPCCVDEARRWLREYDSAHIDALTAAVEGLPHIQDEMFDGKAMIDRAAVLAIIRGEQ